LQIEAHWKKDVRKKHQVEDYVRIKNFANLHESIDEAILQNSCFWGILF